MLSGSRLRLPLGTWRWFASERLKRSIAIVAPALVMWLLAPALMQGEAGTEKPVAPLVFENGDPAQLLYRPDLMRLRAGSGWLRTRRVVNDFVLTAEFKLNDANSQAGVGIRTLSVADHWPKRGYRLRLAAGEVAVIEARGRAAAALVPSAARVSAGVWHTLVVRAEGSQINVAIDANPPSVAAIQDYVGSVLFDVRRGSAEFREIDVKTLPAPPVSFVRTENSAPAECESPRLRKEVKPSYTESAMRRKVEGVVELSAVVLPDGRVGAVEVTKLFDPDLEHAAVAALIEWRFYPGKCGGEVVPVRVSVELTFTLR